MKSARFIHVTVLSILALIEGQADAGSLSSTFVSSRGRDSRPCTYNAPCRHIAAALLQAAADAEVVVLDSGEYGTFTITQGVTITAPFGIYAEVAGTTGDAITIAAPGAKVTLRGLTINGQGGDNGVVMSDGASLVVDNCILNNFNLSETASAIYVNTPATVNISKATLNNNYNGILLQGGAQANISGSKLNNNSGAGIAVFQNLGNSTARVVVSESTLLFNGFGIYAGNPPAQGVSPVLDVTNVTANYNSTGIFVNVGSIATVSGSTFANNYQALDIENGSILYSSGNNKFSGNGINIYGAVTPLPTMITN